MIAFRLAPLVILAALCAAGSPAAAPAPQPFASVSALKEAFADTTSPGALPSASVQAHLAADFFRDVFIADARAVPGAGLRVRTGEHLAELGQTITCTGALAREAGELFLDATAPGGGIEVMPDVPWRPSDPCPASLADLKARPELYQAQLIQTPPVRVKGIRRDANGVPWLVMVEAGEEVLSVFIGDDVLPALWEGDELAGVRGIWLRRGQYWNLQPRHAGDFLTKAWGAFRGERPPERSLRPDAYHLEWQQGPGGAPLVQRPPEARFLLDEICYDPFARQDGEGSESFAVVNAGDRRGSLAGWSVTDNEGTWRFPDRAALGPGEKLHVARDDERFYFEFGFMPDFNFGDQPTPGDSALVLDNGGDELLLLDPQGRIADAVVFGDGWSAAQGGWSGPGVLPYRFSDYVPAEGQVLWRKRDPASAARLDTDTLHDWISDPEDPDLGRQLAFPAWDRDRFWDSARCSERAEIAAFVSPDNSFAGVRDFLRSARHSLEIEIYLFTHPLLADELAAAMSRGVRVTLLLDGEVFGSRGGTHDTVRAIARSISEHPSGLGRVFFWRNGDDPRHRGEDADVPDRYNHCHEKFILADRERALISSDNLTQSSLPAAGGGSRGAFLVTDASCVIRRLVEIWEADCDPTSHRDVRPYVTREGLAETQPRPSASEGSYAAVQPEIFSTRAPASFELSHSPENAMRPDRAYLGLLARAGAGDWILVEQQYERLHWGDGARPTPNPRLEAYLAAARRGARVRVLVDGAAGVEREVKNAASCREMNAIARREGLDLDFRMARLPDARPGREGPIHNKMMLVRAGGEFWSHVGSANGSETAHLYNRELGLSIESRALFEYLAAVFRADWEGCALPDPHDPNAGRTALGIELPETWDLPGRR